MAHNRAYRARLSLTPSELQAVRLLVDGAFQESEDREFWEKLAGKCERAQLRANCAPFDAAHVRQAFDVDEKEGSDV